MLLCCFVQHAASGQPVHWPMGTLSKYMCWYTSMVATTVVESIVYCGTSLTVMMTVQLPAAGTVTVTTACHVVQPYCNQTRAPEHLPHRQIISATEVIRQCQHVDAAEALSKTFRNSAPVYRPLLLQQYSCHNRFILHYAAEPMLTDEHSLVTEGSNFPT